MIKVFGWHMKLLGLNGATFNIDLCPCSDNIKISKSVKQITGSNFNWNHGELVQNALKMAFLKPVINSKMISHDYKSQEKSGIK